MVKFNELVAGRLFFERGHYDKAIKAFRKRLAQAEAKGNMPQVAAALNALGFVEQFRGRTDAALEHGRQALTAYRALQDDAASARVLNNMGMLHLNLEQFGQAELSFRSAFMLAQRIGKRKLRVQIQLNRAKLALEQKEFDAAHDFCMEVFDEFTRTGSEPGLSELYLLYGVLYRESGNEDLAASHFALALRLAKACGNDFLEAETERERAVMHINAGRHREALEHLSQAHRLFETMRGRGELADPDRKIERVENLSRSVVEKHERKWALS
jgi:tetratricopeptide (TPR) repeat protein